MPPLLLTTSTQIDWPATIGLVVAWAFASLGALEKIWGWFTGGVKKEKEAAAKELTDPRAAIGQFVDKDALEKRFTEIEARAKLVASEVANQHNTLMEYLRERERLAGLFDGGIKQLQKDMHLLEPVPGRVANLEAKFENLTSQIGDLKNGQGELKSEMRSNKAEMREDMAASKNDILAAINRLTRQ